MKVSDLLSMIMQASTVEMADVMRSEGKIYVVVGALLLVFGAMSLYLFFLDRKIRQLAREDKADRLEVEENDI